MRHAATALPAHAAVRHRRWSTGRRSMKFRRCTSFHAWLEDDAHFDIGAVLAGGDGLVRRPRWMAVAPDVPVPREVSLADLAVLEAVSADAALDRDALAAGHG